jgi:hypothetical protein
MSRSPSRNFTVSPIRLSLSARVSGKEYPMASDFVVSFRDRDDGR